MRRKTEYASQGSNAGAGESLEIRPPCSLPDFTRYREEPSRFAKECLGSIWWQAQEEIATLLTTHRRVAVKAANGVGKTYLAADIVLWFLYCHRPSIVLTTAPTWRQVISLLWEEIRRRHRTVNGRVEAGLGGVPLEGTLLQTQLKIAEGHFAMGLSTDEPVRFQGFHAENLLVVLDEACGVPEEIWDAVEGICVGSNNRVLAISNPLNASGRFYELFQSSRWKTYTISALDHPNITGAGLPGNSQEERRLIPGAVTREAIADRIATWCEPETTGKEGETALAGTLVWEGKPYRPGPLFRSRVLGQFPGAGEDSLFSRDWIEDAMQKSLLSEVAPAVNSVSPLCVLAVDVARFGSDETVFALRRGSVVLQMKGCRNLDTMTTANYAKEIAIAERADMVLVDVVGVGAGVVDRLHEMGVAGVTAVNFGSKPTSGRNAEQFLNLRAQTYWTLREYLQKGEIVLPQDVALASQLAGLRYEFTLTGQIQIEGKDTMRRRGVSSPDRADAVAMLFGPFTQSGECLSVERRLPQEDREMRPVLVPWDSITLW